MAPQPVPKSAQISPLFGAENHASKTVSVLNRCVEETSTETLEERGSQWGEVLAKGGPPFRFQKIYNKIRPASFKASGILFKTQKRRSALDASPFSFLTNELCLSRSANWANFCTCATLGAGVGIDHKLAVSLRDRVNRAARSTCATGNALITNCVCQR